LLKSREENENYAERLNNLIVENGEKGTEVNPGVNQSSIGQNHLLCRCFLKSICKKNVVNNFKAIEKD
jgi:hypothetical protein